MSNRSRALLASTADILRSPVLRPDRSTPLASRIARLSDRSRGFFDCWRWRGSRCQATGYPQISYRDPGTGKSVTRSVHRVLAELQAGRKLSCDEHVLHATGCGKDCVNPLHHRLGTRAENMAQAAAEGRVRGGKLQPAQILKIIELRHKHGVDISSLACRYSVSNQTIRAILKGQSYSELTGIQRQAPAKGGRPPKLRLVQGGPPTAQPRTRKELAA